MKRLATWASIIKQHLALSVRCAVCGDTVCGLLEKMEGLLILLEGEASRSFSTFYKQYRSTDTDRRLILGYW